jgi:hypothetical protein
MSAASSSAPRNPNEVETREWLDSLDYVIQHSG